MNKWLQYFCIGLVFLLIGFLSWRAMYPVVEDDKGVVQNLLLGYYVDVDAAKENLPEGKVPIIFAQGSFYVDEKAAYVPAGIPPMLSAQRQTGLAFKFAAVQKEDMLAQLDTRLMEWKKQGTSIHSLFLKYDAPMAEINDYAQLIQDIKKKYVVSAYVIVSVLDLSWTNKQYVERLKSVAEEVAYFMFIVPETGINEEQKAMLESFPYEFQLLWPRDTSTENLEERMIPKSDHFLGSVFTVNPKMPTIKDKQEIGILPKFLRKK